MDVVIWGVGHWFHEHYDRLSKFYNIVAVTDSDSSKWNMHIKNDLICHSPREILENKKYNDKVFIISAVDSKVQIEIEKQIRQKMPSADILCTYNSLANNFVLNNSEYNPIYVDMLGNEVSIGKNVKFGTLQFYFDGCNNKVFIDNNVCIERKLSGYFGGGYNSLRIGQNTTIVSLYTDQGEGNISIGSDCMFSSDIEIYQNPTHPFFNVDDSLRVNYGKDVIIGNHVWCGKHVALMSGFQIGNDCIIGYGSISSRQFQLSNVIIAGNPAKIIRKGVVWRRDGIGQYEINRLSDSRFMPINS